jgi:sugar transferase (PEP-CTERM/EpsH1 system associated)
VLVTVPTGPTAASDAPLRVMHVVYELRPGGMELGVVKVVNGLQPGRVRSSICSTRPAGELKHLLAPEVRLFEVQRRKGNDPRLVWTLYRLFRRERPHIVHTHGWGTLLEGLVAARLAGVPIVVHGEHGTLQLRPYQRWLQARAWERTDHVLSVSGRLAERMAREIAYPLHAINTIRNGVDLSRFGRVTRAEARRALDVDPESLVIGTVGRLVPVKNQGMLVDALAMLHAEGLKATLLIAGEGPARESISLRATTLGVQHDVRLLGHRPDVDQILPAFDIFTLPSLSEGLSNTILEAMACRLPVVATRVGGADELVIEALTGLLVPARAPRRFADALASLLRDRSRREAMGAAARLRAESEFSLEAMIGRYEALYTGLAKTTRRLPQRHGEGLHDVAAGPEVA